MPTIQIRNVPEDVHRTYQLRATAAGMSLQEYLLAELNRTAGLRSPADLVGDIEERMRSEGGEGMSRVSASELVAADRQVH